MAVCGGNGMGFFNLDRRLRVCGYPEPAELEPGPVAVISHSGSVFSACSTTAAGCASTWSSRPATSS